MMATSNGIMQPSNDEEGVRDFDNSMDPTRIEKLTAIIGPELFSTNGSALLRKGAGIFCSELLMT